MCIRDRDRAGHRPDRRAGDPHPACDLARHRSMRWRCHRLDSRGDDPDGRVPRVSDGQVGHHRRRRCRLAGSRPLGTAGCLTVCDRSAHGNRGCAHRGADSVTPVSYTHLDVYKRQGYNKAWAATHPASSTWAWVPGDLRSWWNYQAQILEFHRGLSSPHSYQSSPWSWLVMGLSLIHI